MKLGLRLCAVLLAVIATVPMSAHADDRPLLIITANNAESVWGDAFPAFTLSYSGFIDEDDENVLDTLIIAATEATAEDNVGTYNIVPSLPSEGGGGFGPSEAITDSKYDLQLVNGTHTIVKADQTITSFEPFLSTPFTSKDVDDASFQLSAITSSGLTPSFVGTGACTVTGTTTQMTVSGVCTITASQAGDINRNAATSVVRTFDVTDATPAVVAEPEVHRRGGGGGSRVRNNGGRVLGDSTYYFSKDLYIWDKGQDVRELQKILIADRRKLDLYAPSGFFGRKTQAALRLYQSEHGINTTGNAGPLTRAVLNAKQTIVSADIQQQILALQELLKVLQAKLNS